MPTGLAGLEVDCILFPCVSGPSASKFPGPLIEYAVPRAPAQTCRIQVCGLWFWELAGSADFLGESPILCHLWAWALGSIKMGLTGLESEKILGHIAVS